MLHAEFLKIENYLLLQPMYVMMSLWSIIKTQKLPPPREATDKTTYISYLARDISYVSQSYSAAQWCGLWLTLS